MFYTNAFEPKNTYKEKVVLGLEGAYKFLYESEMEWQKINTVAISESYITEDDTYDENGNPNGIFVRMFRKIKEWLEKVWEKLKSFDITRRSVMKARLMKCTEFWNKYGDELKLQLNTVFKKNSFKNIMRAGNFAGYTFDMLDESPKRLNDVMSKELRGLKETGILFFKSNADKNYTEADKQDDMDHLDSAVKGVFKNTTGNTMAEYINNGMRGDHRDSLPVEIIKEQILRIDPNHPESYKKVQDAGERYIDDMNKNFNELKDAYDNAIKTCQNSSSKFDKVKIHGQTRKNEVVKSAINIVAVIRSCYSKAVSERITQSMRFATQLIGHGSIEIDKNGKEYSETES